MSRPPKLKPPPPMTRAQATAMGLIVSHWSMVEDMMGLAVGTLLAKSSRPYVRLTG